MIFFSFSANFFECWRFLIGCSAESTKIQKNSPKRQKYDLTSFLKIPHIQGQIISYYKIKLNFIYIFQKKNTEQVFPGREDGAEETFEERFFLEINCAPVTTAAPTTTAAGRIDRQSDGKNQRHVYVEKCNNF